MDEPQTAALLGQKRGITGTQLKLVAIITMFIDHTAASPIDTYLGLTGAYDSPLSILDFLMRCVGRIAFPIFCFLLVEGFMHTHSFKNYAIRLGAFALISELPFDLAITMKVPDWGYQNVFFTLFLGLISLWFIRQFEGRPLLQILPVLCCVAAGELLRTDYGAMGVIFIVLIYLFKDKGGIKYLVWTLWLLLGQTVFAIPTMVGYVQSGYPLPSVLLSFLFNIEVLGALSFFLIARYNGQRGQSKLPSLVFYAFYPVHLALLGGISYLILQMIG